MSNIDMNKNSENGSSNYTGDDKFVIKNLNLHYGDFHALKNINMNIPKNQITAFIGPSGCGKSTFLKTIAINSILAQTIGTSLSKEYIAPVYRIYSSMA